MKLSSPLRRRFRALFIAACVLVSLNGLTLDRPVLAQSGTATSPRTVDKPQAPSTEGFFDLVLAGGWVGHTIILLSVIAVSLTVEQVLTLRHSSLMPPGLAEKVRDLLRAGQVAQAEQQCKLQPSVLAAVLKSGISELEGGWTDVEKAMEDVVAEQAARLYRKAEYISVIGNIAPMLGLLGTVIGMIEAFSQVAATEGVANPRDLSHGIYLALVTTVEGLVVAIPALGVFAMLRNRIDGLIAETAYVAQHVFAPLRRGNVRRAVPVQPPPSGPHA